MMKKEKLIFLIVIIAYICIAVTFIFYSYYGKPIFVREIGMNIEVIESEQKVMGMNIDIDALHFGIFRPGMTSTRGINLTNIFDEDAVVTIETDGSEIAEWVSVSENLVPVKKGESKIVDVSCSIPQNASPGNYTGKLYVTYKKV